MIVTILVFIVLLGVLVLVHEFGHFIMARRAGMQVEEFGIGFPPRLWSTKRGETTYSINAVPLGGFVRIVGENNEESGNPRSFINKGFWPRFSTLIAGVVMNVLLAWVLLSVVLVIGMPTVVTPGDTVTKPATLKGAVLTVLDVSQNSPSISAGIKPGDRLISVNGKEVSDPDQFISEVNAHPGETVAIGAAHGNTTYTATVLVRQNPPEGEGRIGIALGNVGKMSYPWYIAPWPAARTTVSIIGSTFSGFYHLVFQGQGVKQLGGPVKIAQLTGEVTKLGIVYLLQFAALLSVNLAVLNAVPFPALDGGRILFLVIEKIRGKRNNEKIEQYANLIGFALLIILILFISVNDVRGLLH